MSKTTLTLTINQQDSEIDPKTTSETTIQTDSFEELQRLLSLAGMPGTAPESALVGPIEPEVAVEPVMAELPVEEQEAYTQVSSHQVRKPEQLRNNPRFGDNSLAEDGEVSEPDTGLSTAAEIAIADTYWDFAKFTDHDEAVARTADAYGINGDLVERLVADFQVYEEQVELPSDPLEEEEEILDESPMMKSFRDYVREREEQFKPEVVSEDEINAAMNEAVGKNKPFRFNVAAMGIVPANIMKARTAEEQIDMLYAVADAPGTDRSHSEQLLRLISKINAKLNKNVNEAGTDLTISKHGEISGPLKDHMSPQEAKSYLERFPYGVLQHDMFEQYSFIFLNKAGQWKFWHSVNNKVMDWDWDADIKDMIEDEDDVRRINQGWWYEPADEFFPQVYHNRPGFFDELMGESMDEAYGSSRHAKHGGFKGTVALLPIPQMMVTLDQLQDNEYFGDGLQSGQSGVVCFAIETSSGKPRLTYASSWGNVSEFKTGDRYMTYHDQTGAERPATVITAFNGTEYMDPKGREAIKQRMASGGMDPRKKYSVRVFK